MTSLVELKKEFSEKITEMGQSEDGIELSAILGAFDTIVSKAFPSQPTVKPSVAVKTKKVSTALVCSAIVKTTGSPCTSPAKIGGKCGRHGEKIPTAWQEAVKKAREENPEEFKGCAPKKDTAFYNRAKELEQTMASYKQKTK